MSNRPMAAGAAARRRRRLGRLGWALAALLSSWTVASGDARAERIVLNNGEVIEGSIVEATRNTVVVRRSIGGMRQMRMRDIAEVRFDLASGQEMAGEFLGWTDGVYELGAGDEVIRLSEGGIVSREPRQRTAEQPPRTPASAPGGQQPITAAAPPSVAAERTAAPDPDDQSNAAAVAESEATADAQSSADGDTESQAAAAAQGEAADDTESQTAAVAEGEAAGPAEGRDSDAGGNAAADAESIAAPDAETRAAADAAAQTGAEASSRAVAGDESAAVADQARLAVGDQAALAVKASVDPLEPGAQSMVFKIELSEPADQTVVLIYGTVDGTAKAGEDYEARQGMVTLAPGARSAEVRVPLLEGHPQEGEKRFELVLMADPNVAEIVDRRVIATIKGAD